MIRRKKRTAELIKSVCLGIIIALIFTYILIYPYTASNKAIPCYTTLTTEATTEKNTLLDDHREITVYITRTGKKYHYKNPCGNGSYFPIAISKAKKIGYSPCENAFCINSI